MDAADASAEMQASADAEPAEDGHAESPAAVAADEHIRPATVDQVVGGLEANVGLADQTSFSSDSLRLLVNEINRFRRNPPLYGREMAKLRQSYREQVFVNEDGSEVDTIEGVSALEECLADLELAAKIPTLTLSEALCRASQAHLVDLSVGDFCSHIGSDGSTPEERLARFGNHRYQCGENIMFGVTSARQFVYRMLIDDGCPERGHRANLLNGDFHFIGGALGSHPSAGSAAVVMFVDHFIVKQMNQHQLMRGVVEAVTGARVPTRDGENAGVTSEKAWDLLMEDLKPPHLQVPKGLRESIWRNHRPSAYRGKRERVPVQAEPVGSAAPKSGTHASTNLDCTFPTVTFAAKRDFAQSVAKQDRASGPVSTGMKGALSAAVGASATLLLAATSASAPEMRAAARTRGAGAHSLSAPNGIMGHYHNTVAVNQRYSSHAWPQSLDVRLDGTHIDHAKLQPQKDVETFGQPKGYAYMTKEERATQFTTYVKVPDTHAAKCHKASDVINDSGVYKDWKKHEFREDVPKRLGRFGRRDYDTFVGSQSHRPGISQLDDKPMYQRVHDSERQVEVRERSLPSGQTQPFVQYMPKSAQAGPTESMATKETFRSVMSGQQKMNDLGFGQKRHTDSTDFRLYTRGLGVSLMDKMLPMA